MTIKLALLTVAMLSLAACVTAPVQEMSDARQAIRSAEVAGALQNSPDSFSEARRLLREAQARLEIGAYDDARRLALEARDHAIAAREQAVQATSMRSTPP
ncbi:MAG: DUF4398 domain-containing protein [Candidatus Competibacter sp.]